ncbi:hypothetical protein Tco_1073106 [Tanacetum coccineum]
MYTEVFGIDVPLSQSQPTESIQGMHRTPSAPRSLNPNMDARMSSAPKRSTMIHFRIPQRRSTRLTPPAPVPTVDKADEIILQDKLQVSLAEYKSQEEQEARENVELVNKHLASMEIEKMMEGPENVEITNNEEVEITNVVIPVNVNEEEEEITDEVYELKRREKGKIVKESRSTPFPTPIRSPRIHTDLVSSDTKKLQELTMKFETFQVPQTACRTSAVRPRDQDDPHPEGENSAKRRKTSEYEAHVTEESSGQVNEKEQGQSSLRNQEQTDDYDFWTESYALDDDEILMKQVSQDIMEEVSLTINEAELKKIADEMLRQRCTSGYEHQYHIDQMKNFLKSDIVWESRKEILASLHPRNNTPFKAVREILKLQHCL